MSEDWVVLEAPDEPKEVREVKADYDTLEEIMGRWKLENCHHPFTKNVVTILGTTSSGKSSFVNHFFQVGVKKVALEQMDTHFTIVESVPEEDFARLVGNYKRKNIPVDKISNPVQDSYSDARRNVVYMILDTASTIARHQQFENFSKVFRKHELVNSILINEYYLRGDPERLAMLKNTILIDSPGFTAETQIAKLKGNLEILQYMYSLSDLTLFFIASDSINLVASQISMLELSILYAFHGQTHFAQTLTEMLATKDPSFSFSVTDLFSAVMRKIRQSPSKQNSTYDGTSYWDKVKFILSKIDNVTMRCVCEKEIRPEAQFFELGTTLGRNLRFLKPPVFDQCFAIAIPEQQTFRTKKDQIHRLDDDKLDEPNTKISDRKKRPSDTIVTGDLDRLVSSISSLNFYDSYSVRLDSSIQKMCGELEEKIKESWAYSAFLARNDVTLVKSIRDKSKERSRKRAS